MAARRLQKHLEEAGAKLLNALDDAGLAARGAAWIFDHNLRDWNFVVATSLIETMGRSHVYQRLLSVMKQMDLPAELTIADIHLISTESPLFKTISRGIIMTAGPNYLQNCVFFGVLLDAVMYRWLGPPTKQEAKRADQVFKRRIKEMAV
jgi:hypothetical protein